MMSMLLLIICTVLVRETLGAGCPPGVKEFTCTVNPCQDLLCRDNPHAKCRANYCGGCNAVFYDNNDNVVDCGDVHHNYLRIVPGDRNEGRIELNLNGHWGSICDRDWNDAAASVICKNMGYNGPSRIIGTRGDDVSASTRPFTVSRITCNGNETSVWQCKMDQPPNVCTAGEAQIACSYAAEGELRLENGANENEGRLEVYKNGEWGSVCEKGFDQKDAVVACRQLGFYGMNAVVKLGAQYGQSSGSIHYRDVECPEGAIHLDECTYKAPSLDDQDPCAHNNDVGIVCEYAQPCPRGTFSEYGYRPCTPCYYDTYAVHYGQMECSECPNGRKTLIEGAVQVSECYGHYGNYEINRSKKNINDLANNQIYMPFGGASDAITMDSAIVIGWNVYVLTNDRVQLGFWKELTRREFEFVGGTWVQFNTTGPHQYLLSDSEKFAVSRGDAIGIIWSGQPVVAKRGIECHRNNAFRLKVENVHGTIFLPGDRILMADSELDPHQCVSFLAQAIVEKVYPNQM